MKAKKWRRNEREEGSVHRERTTRRKKRKCDIERRYKERREWRNEYVDSMGTKIDAKKGMREDVKRKTKKKGSEEDLRRKERKKERENKMAGKGM
jgi:hypothetical protein